MPRPSEPDSKGTVWVDVSDLLMFLSHHPVVSGIQRVVVEVIPYLGGEDVCNYVAFDATRASFVRIDPARLATVLAKVRNERGSELDVVAEANALRLEIPRRPIVSGAEGDVIAILGAGWSFPGMFGALRRMKDRGAAVLVLLYDLIPVVLPGFPEAVVGQFREYLPRVAQIADRVPAISVATRTDFEQYCLQRGWDPPAGVVTRLAGDQWSAERLEALGVEAGPAWPRPFVLFVSTVEIRKNHILALRGWRRLIEELGPDRVPDLVCVGRLGWNAFEFLAEFRQGEGEGHRVHLLTESLTDARLAALYRDCMFTIYPSRYEGWGLPVAESLDMGKPVVVARNSSLTEVGGQLANYFDDDDLDGFVDAVRHYVTDEQALLTDADRIVREHRALSWGDVGAVLLEEFDRARAGRRPVDRRVQLGVEYALKGQKPYEGDPMGQSFLDHLEAQRLPMTGQYLGVERAVAVDLLVDQPYGNNDSLSFTFLRPTSEPLFLLLCFNRLHTPTRTTMSGPRGVISLSSGSGIALVALGSGAVDELLNIQISPGRGRMSRPFVRSFLVLSDAQAAGDLAEMGPRNRVGFHERSVRSRRVRRALSTGPSGITAKIRRRLGH